LAEYERLVPERTRRGHPGQLAAAAAIALAEGRVRDAIVGYRAWTEQAENPADGLFELATAYERARQPDSALAVYERSVAARGVSPNAYTIEEDAGGGTRVPAGSPGG